MSTPNSLSGRKSPRKHAAAEETTKKKMKKLASSSSPVQSNPIWNEEDELSLLKGLVDYRAKTGLLPDVDSDAFHGILGDSIAAKFSKEEIQSKIRHLKERFSSRMEKINPGDDPVYSDAEEAFGYSNMIWGQNDSDSDFSNVQIKNVDNVEPLKATEIDFDAGDGNGNDDDVDAADELSNVRDAFETLVAHGLSDYEKKIQLRKLMNIGTGRRRQLSDGWKKLGDEEVEFRMKEIRFLAKLAKEAANGIE